MHKTLFSIFLVLCNSIIYSYDLEQFNKEIKTWPQFQSNNFRKNHYFNKKRQFSPKPIIPKIIHQIWLGSPVPEKFHKAMESWKRLHPEWKYMLWTDKEAAQLKMQNKKYYDLATNYGMKSDILRMEIIRKYGGLYVDTDQYCIKPHDIFHHISSLYLGIMDMNRGNLRLNNNVIAAKKNHPLIQKWIDKLPHQFKNIKTKYMNPESTLFITGPFYLTSLIFKRARGFKDIQIYPKQFFNPLKTQKNSTIDINSVAKKLSPHTYSVHFHTCSWD